MSVVLDFETGHLTGVEVTWSARTLGGLTGYFRDEAARAALDQEKPAYRVCAYEPEPEGRPGAVCCATTYLEAGTVGDEYFMTRGHFHADQDCAELCVAISGEGALVLMDEDRRTWIETLRPGIVHPIPPRTAHRAANTGEAPLVFMSYWPSETGHDYATIAERGFGARLRCIDGVPTLVPEPDQP